MYEKQRYVDNKRNSEKAVCGLMASQKGFQLLYAASDSFFYDYRTPDPRSNRLLASYERYSAYSAIYLSI